MTESGMLALWLLAMAVVLAPRPAEGCMCQPSHPQEQYCRADFAVLAGIVTGREEEDYLRRYEISVKRVFKGGAAARALLKGAGVVAPYMDSLCGVTLKEGEVYLLMGRVYEKQPRVTLCDTPTPWKKVTVRQRKGLRLQYGHSCSCKPHQCPWWGRSHRAESCLRSHSVCTAIHRHGSCNWLRGRVLDECLRWAGVEDVDGEHSAWLTKMERREKEEIDKVDKEDSVRTVLDVEP